KVVTLEDILATKALWGSPSSHRGTGNATLGCEEGFDSDIRDNIWGARISDPGLDVPMGYVVVPLIGAIIAAAVVIVRRR
ncbi:MAG TPA: hypothetical protein P5189_05135, partial [Methanomassiliicoccales archaeon]|nr:hypothetical protein [Methanomassiliicoccales archaeon]